MVKPLTKYSAGTYENRFGGWRKALEAFVSHINEGNYTSIESKPNTSRKNVKLHSTKRSISWRLRFVIMRRDNFKCTICGKSPASDSGIILHIDHIHPWAKGGETIPENLQTLCSKCNIGKSNLPMDG